MTSLLCTEYSCTDTFTPKSHKAELTVAPPKIMYDTLNKGFSYAFVQSTADVHKVDYQ